MWTLETNGERESQEIIGGSMKKKLQDVEYVT